MFETIAEGVYDASTDAISWTMVPTMAVDLKRGDVIDYRTHRNRYQFTVVSTERVEGEWGTLRITLSRKGHGTHTFRTHATDKFDRRTS
jgi:hypothetical protein